MRGEGMSASSHCRTCWGRSPHARGRRSISEYGAFGERSIPACAGKAQWGNSLAVRIPVDPRMRGEGSREWDLTDIEMGRSPHARGRLGTAGSAWTAARSIPACAGKAQALCAPTIAAMVDPRMRGEGHLVPRDYCIERGRSPHARGRQCPALPPKLALGSIPACAGKALGINFLN